MTWKTIKRFQEMDKYQEIHEEMNCSVVDGEDFAVYHYNGEGYSYVCHGSFLRSACEDGEEGVLVDYQIIHHGESVFEEVYDWFLNESPFKTCFKHHGVYKGVRYTVQDNSVDGVLPIFFNLQQMRLLRTRSPQVDTYTSARKSGANIPMALMLANAFHMDFIGSSFRLSIPQDFTSVSYQEKVFSAVKVYKDGGDFLENSDYYYDHEEYMRSRINEQRPETLTFHQLHQKHDGNISKIVEEVMSIYEQV